MLLTKPRLALTSARMITIMGLLLMLVSPTSYASNQALTPGQIIFPDTESTKTESTDGNSAFSTFQAIRQIQGSIVQAEADISFLQSKIEEIREGFQAFRSNLVTFLAADDETQLGSFVYNLEVFQQLGQDLQALDEQTYNLYLPVFSSGEVPADFDELADDLLSQLDERIDERISARQQDLSFKSIALDNLQDEQDRLENLLQTQLRQMGRTLGWYAVIFLLILFIRRLTLRLVQHVHGKSETFLHAHKLIFNILTTLVIVALISTSFLRVLASLSIIATALVIVLKEVILSYFAWFVVGGEDGYQPKDMIEIGDDIFGRVVKIGILQTTLRQLGKNGQTGRIFTFPNKIIFEKPVLNWSRLGGVNFIFMDFLLTQESNVTKAKKILLDLMNACNEPSQDKIKRNMAKAKRVGGLTEEMVQPNVHISPDSRGILIRARLFVDLDQRNHIRTEIMEQFIEKVRKDKDITLKFVEIGEQG